ncbi:hypothetical protein E6C76_20550 [Pseudothauera nasutitermitis]|uniref:Uncharacterized protein n=1 Tax=Pseudothauera nasutitermitis TaxID=2565930 RepID=A0A4S4AQE0_9RHOO|nr:hypothetical protein [Pseudothauera nasutitermitis]THF61472.1 hypothetical protein E6C76_20550 [Pseudothauera nasutitermitis]
MTDARDAGPAMPVWQAPDGSPIACVEKLRVLAQNHQELHQVALDALEDALLMGCCEQQVRAALHALIDALEPRFGGSLPQR